MAEVGDEDVGEARRWRLTKDGKGGEGGLEGVWSEAALPFRVVTKANAPIHSPFGNVVAGVWREIQLVAKEHPGAFSGQ